MSIKDVKNIGKNIGKDKAKKWVDKYKEKHPDPTKEGTVWGWLYGEDILKKLLDYENAKGEKAEGIWFFKGLDGKDEKLVLYAADKDGKIIEGVSSLGAMAADKEDPADEGSTCPPSCP